ncbi:MAG: hypothetical protein ABI197_12545 [Granulicella sp.]
MMKALMAVLPKATGIIPVGGVDEKNIYAWMAEGAIGVGISSSIYRRGNDAAIVRSKIKALMTGLHAK